MVGRRWKSPFFVGFYLISSSEFERFTLSVCNVVEPKCFVRVDPATPITPLPKTVTTEAVVQRETERDNKNTVGLVFSNDYYYY